MAGAQLGIWILRAAVSLVFLVSGFLKLLDPGRFLLDVQAFELLPYSLAFGAALALPWLEILAAVGLWWRRLGTGSPLLLGLATLGFIGALGIANARGLERDCGCFGEWLVFPNMAAHVAFNCGLVAACLVLLRFPAGDRRERTHV